jgi:cation-transporting ATPase E
MLYSGSFCLTGNAAYRAVKVGSESVAGQLTAGARTFRRVSAPLQRHITSIIQALLLLALYIESILVLDALASRSSVVDVVRMSVVSSGLCLLACCSQAVSPMPLVLCALQARMPWCSD